MKKILYILFSILYLTFTIGITFSNTYCNGYFAEKQVVFTQYSGPASCECCCENCEVTCCVAEIRTIKIQDNYNLIHTDYSIEKDVILVLNAELVKDLTSDLSYRLHHTTNFSFSNDIYLKSSVLLI
ncbi:MAG: hypothetical protein JW995_07295 [Melioribacteraceae bacterium]|nr:hypothetical protein [Melioribacteraceae bacterium]